MIFSGLIASFATLFNTIFNTICSMQGFFRLANFGVFIALIIYLYRRYIKDFITAQIKAEEAVFEGLMIEQQEAQQTHDKYAQLVANSAQQQAHLQNMIGVWNAAVERERTTQALEKSSLLLARKQKAEHLAEQLRKQVIAKRVMPDALAAARRELREMFSHNQEGEKMVQDIIAHAKSHSHKSKA